jgi:heme A synthase
MRKVYSGIAWLIAGLVVVQAAAIALGFGGMMHFVDGGGVVDKGLTESRTLGNFTGEIGFPIHGIVGGILIPVAAIALLVVSWFTKLRGASWWAAGLFVLIALQGMVGYSIKDLPFLGVLHGANALAVFAVAVVCARRTRPAAVSRVSEPATANVTS